MPTTTKKFLNRLMHNAYTQDLATGGLSNVYRYDQTSAVASMETLRETNSNPLWMKKVLLGQDASNKYRRYETTLHSQSPMLAVMLYQYLTTRSMMVVKYNNQFAWPSANVTDSTLRDQALARVKRRINNMTETYQSLIPLAELRELRGLVGSLTSITTDTVKMIAELKRTKGRSLFSHVSKLWLTYSFGVRPMMADALDLSNSIWAYLTKGDIKNSRVRGTASKEWVTQSNTWATGVTGTYLLPVKYRYSTACYLSYRFTGAWNFNLRSNADYSALAHFGVTPPALVPALWETTAFSWVADYFGTLGDFLEDQFIGQAGSSAYFVENRYYRARTTGVLRGDFPSSNASQTFTPKYDIPGTWDVERFELDRTPLASLPSRILRWKTMDEMGLRGVTKLLNLTAVLLSKK